MKYSIQVSGRANQIGVLKAIAIYELPSLNSNPLPRNYKNNTYLKSIHQKSVNRNSIQEQIRRKLNLR